MTKSHFVYLLLAIGAGALVFESASAAVFNDLATFQAAAPNLTLINFDTTPGGSPTVDNSEIGNTYASWGAVFPPGNRISQAFFGPVSLPKGWINDTSVGSDRVFDVNFTSGNVRAVGVHNVLEASRTRLDAFNGASIVGTVFSDAIASTLDFYGVTTAQPITRVTITALAPQGWGLDNLYFGPIVPEPSTLMMASIGCLAVTCARRLRRTR
jgi:hypothetical protein